MEATCIDELLMRGCDDWIQAAEVASVAVEIGHADTPDAIRTMSLQMIRWVVEQHLMELGDVDIECATSEAFRPWTLPATDAVARVEDAWKSLGRNPGLWELCWLRNTSAGDARGEALLQQREPRE